MRRKLTHAFLGMSLLAAVVAGAPTSVGAQGGWGGFTATSVPSLVGDGAPTTNTSAAWAVAVTNDLGGNGVDLWVNNHASSSEALIDYTGGQSVFAGAARSPLFPLQSDTHGAAFSDIDNDGDDDLLEVAGRTHDSEIFINNAGTLELLNQTTGLEDNDGRGRQPLMLDIDDDNDMDVIVANLDRADPPINDPDNPHPTELYLNNGDGTSWTKVADPGQVISDGNLRLLSLTSTGPGTSPVVLTHNTFAVALDSVATGSATLAEGRPVNQFLFAADNATNIRDVALADLDGDLSPDFIAARQQDYLGMGADGMGTDPSQAGNLPLGIGKISTNGLDPSVIQPVSADALVDNCRAVALADYDNDADVDIFAGCAMKEKNQDKNVVLLNDGDGNFTIAAAAVNATGANTSSVVVTADFNDDGWIDTYVGTGYDNQGGPDHIFLNDKGTANHWLKVDLVGSNPDAMGAQVFVGTDKWQVRETGHRMHQGQDMKTLHFGLGSQTAVAPLQIRWPDGTYQRCAVSGIDRTVTVTQGGVGCVNTSQSGLVDAVNGDPGNPAAKRCRGRIVTIDLNDGPALATNGNDVILGTPGNDTINALDGDDVVCGGAGNDTISGGDGIDRIYGDAGNDNINGGDGRDRLFGGDNRDTIFGGKNRDVIVGGKQADTLVGDGGRDRITGSVGDDTIVGSGGDDQLKGGRGFDIGRGGRGENTCIQIEDARNCEV